MGKSEKKKAIWTLLSDSTIKMIIHVALSQLINYQKIQPSINPSFHGRGNENYSPTPRMQWLIKNYRPIILNPKQHSAPPKKNTDGFSIRSNLCAIVMLQMQKNHSKFSTLSWYFIYFFQNPPARTKSHHNQNKIRRPFPTKVYP